MSKTTTLQPKSAVQTRQRTKAGYKVAGTTADGVDILQPKAKPSHFTVREIRTALRKLPRTGLAGPVLAE